jgi:hypothetical protein
MLEVELARALALVVLATLVILGGLPLLLDLADVGLR